MDQETIIFPNKLHSRIIEKAFFERFKITSYVILFFLALGSLLSAFRVVNQIIEKDTISIIEQAFDGFEMSFYFLSSFINSVLDALPLFVITIFLINFMLLIYFARMFFKWKTKSIV